MSKHLVKVTITYCSECGYEPQTLALTEALMKAFRHELAEIAIVPWYDGSFEVAVDGELVHSMYRDDGFPAHSVIIEAVRRHQAAAKPAEAPSATTRKE